MPIDTDNQRFEEAQQDVLSALAEQVGLDVWMVSRREGDELRVVATAGTGLEVERGLAIPWADAPAWPPAKVPALFPISRRSPRTRAPRS